MRKYKNQLELSHAWAHQTSADGEAGNVYFIDTRLYSYGYHYVMFNLYEDQKIILGNSERYSNTTSKQMSVARRAIPNDYDVIYVPTPRAENKADHLDNYKYLVEAMNNAIAAAGRARKNGDARLIQAEHMRVKANKYTKAFKLGKHRIPQTVDVAAIEQRQAEERERYRLRREEYRKQVERESAGLMASWRDGESIHLPYEVRVMLRLERNREGELIVATSKGANFPATHARLAWRIISRCVASGESWHTNGHTIKLGHYQVTSVSAEGELIAGCHVVQYSELEHCARLLGFID